MCLAVSSNYLFGHLTNFPSHLSIACLGSNFKNACRLIVANEVENLHPVFPWQHLTLSASLLCFSGCSVVLWLISSFGALQGDKSTFDMLDTAGHAHMRRHTYTSTQTLSERAYGRHAVPYLQTGESGDVRQRGKASNGELWEYLSLYMASHWCHASSLSDSVCHECMNLCPRGLTIYLCCTGQLEDNKANTNYW